MVQVKNLKKRSTRLKKNLLGLAFRTRNQYVAPKSGRAIDSLQWNPPFMNFQVPMHTNISIDRPKAKFVEDGKVFSLPVITQEMLGNLRIFKKRTTVTYSS